MHLYVLFWDMDMHFFEICFCIFFGWFQLMQEEKDGMAVELQRKEAGIGILRAEKERLLEQLRDLTG